jgi:hypothetical protein
VEAVTGDFAERLPLASNASTPSVYVVAHARPVNEYTVELVLPRSSPFT